MLATCRLHTFMHYAILRLQVTEYLQANNGTASPDTIYFLYIGANDYLNTLGGLANATAEAVLEAIAEAMDTLYQAGARV